MYSITQDNHSTEYVSEKSNRFFQQYQIGKILKAANGNKLQGIPAIHILRLLFTMVFCHRSLFMQMHLHPASIPFGKDTVYRFLNSCHTNWRRFVLLLAGRIREPRTILHGFATFPVFDGKMATYRAFQAFHGNCCAMQIHSLFMSNCIPQAMLKLIKLSCSCS